MELAFEKQNHHENKKRNKKKHLREGNVIKKKGGKKNKKNRMNNKHPTNLSYHDDFFSNNTNNKKNIIDNTKHVLIKPRNEKQKEYFSYLKNPNINIIFAVGSAGTGKTILACLMAISYLLSGKIEKIIITRPTVSADEDIGFLPGTLEEKMAPWLIPIFDIFYEHYSADEVKRMVDNKIIEISPLAYMRGRTLKNAMIIADEMQNTTVNQMKMILTRIGENSKIVCTGDPKQHDRIRARYEINGLQDFINKWKNRAKKCNKIKMVEFEKKDVERSEIVKEILDIYGE